MKTRVAMKGAVGFCWGTLWIITSAAAGQTSADIDAEHARIKARYIRFLVGTEETFEGILGRQAAEAFLSRLEGPVREALSFDFSSHAGETIRKFPGEDGFEEESRTASAILQRYLPALAYGYCVRSAGSPYYFNPEILAAYVRFLEYLDKRGIRAGMTFHYNAQRLKKGVKPPPGVANLVKMELRMGSYCQSLLLMEDYVHKEPVYAKARALARHLEILGKSSGHAQYYEPFVNPEAFRHRVQSDAIQVYSDVTLVSALLEQDTARRGALLLDAKQVFTDSLKVIPGWGDTIKPDFVGYHHRGIYGNAYTGFFIPQAAFGVYLLKGTQYAVDRQSIENLRSLILTYRLYCQKYSMPFGIRGRMPLNSHQIKTGVFSGVLIFASSLGLDDDGMKPVFRRLWDPVEIGLSFLQDGGRGKILRGMYAIDMLKDLTGRSIAPEPDPSGFWYKPYGGLALHRRDDWMAAVKGYSKYIWDYENGSDPNQNVYGQYLSHGMLSLFAGGNPVNDMDSGYNLAHGWDWYRMPGTTAVHFPLIPQKPLDHRRLSAESFLGGVTADDRNGLFAMALNQPIFGDGTQIDLKARKSVFFMGNLILLLGTGISGGDGTHPVETTIFQTYLANTGREALLDGRIFHQGLNAIHSQQPVTLVDPSGNGYYLPAATQLKLFHGEQKSFQENGRSPSSGKYATAWIDHGLNPADGAYEIAVLVRGGAKIAGLGNSPHSYYQVRRQDRDLHQVYFPREKQTGYVFFRAQEISDSILERAEAPCLILMQQSNEQLKIGVVNPDLGLLESNETADFRRLSDEDVQYRESRPMPVEITFKGHWDVTAAPDGGVEVMNRSADRTVFRFTSRDGMSVKLELNRIRR